jgi:hypothetical protein
MVDAAMAKACRTAPEVFRRRVYLVRAFTCGQVTTRLGDRLDQLLQFLGRIAVVVARRGFGSSANPVVVLRPCKRRSPTGLATTRVKPMPYDTWG